MSSFVFMDKENASQVNVMARTIGAGIRSVVSAKVFNGENSSIAPTPGRLALRDVNRQITTPNPSALKGPIKPAPFTAKPINLKQGPQKQQAKHKQVIKKPEVKVCVEQPSIPDVPDIEFMPPPPPEEEDDFADLWPLNEQPTTYIDKLKAWRPWICELGSSDVEDKEFAGVIDSPDSLHIERDTMELSMETKCYFEDESGFSLSSIPLPPLDDEVLDDCHLYRLL